jgi:hypothetical protein
MYPHWAYTLLSLTPFPPPPIFQEISTLYFYPLPSQMLYFTILLMLHHSLSFPLPNFHRVVLQLQMCSMYEFVYDHACFCVYVSLFNLSCMSDNMQPLSF